jgi:hypothetical protein
MKMRILMSAVVLGVGLLSGEMVETEAATQPVNINTFILEPIPIGRSTCR